MSAMAVTGFVVKAVATRIGVIRTAMAANVVLRAAFRFQPRLIKADDT